MAKPADRPRCSARVSIDVWHQGTCSRRGAVERDGQWYYTGGVVLSAEECDALVARLAEVPR